MGYEAASALRKGEKRSTCSLLGRCAGSGPDLHRHSLYVSPVGSTGPYFVYRLGEARLANLRGLDLHTDALHTELVGDLAHEEDQQQDLASATIALRQQIPGCKST